MKNDKSSSSHFDNGVRFFNQQRYFDAHEEFEDAWRPSFGEARLFLQGITQVAVALHHQSTGNTIGAKSVMARALRNLSGYPNHFGGIDLEALRATLRSWTSGTLKGTEPPPVPRIESLPAKNVE